MAPQHVRILALAGLTTLLLTAPLAAQTASVTVIGPSGEQRIAADQIAALPTVTVRIVDHEKPAQFEGVELRHLLENAGVPFGERLRGKDVARYVVVEAADGYRAVFALAELDPGFTDRKVILAVRRDGQPLAEDVGPFQVIVEGEKRMARSVRQVTRLVVGMAGGPAPEKSRR